VDNGPKRGLRKHLCTGKKEKLGGFPENRKLKGIKKEAPPEMK